jgi:hypothetical protein
VRHRYLLVLALAIAVAGSLIAGAAATGPGGWDHLGTGGTAGSASLNAAVSVLNADMPGKLLVGGNFTDAGGVVNADRLASWNGLAWSAVGPGVNNGIVMAIASKDGKVYIGGSFTNVGGTTGLDRLAVWDGVSWQSPCNATLPVVDGNVTDLQIIGDKLWAGGEFQNGAGDSTADYLLSCDLNTGTPSSPFAPNGGTGPMYALAADSAGNLYGAGAFTNLAGIPEADHVAKYTGGTWQAMGSGPTPTLGAVTGSFTRSITTKGTDVFIGSDATDIAGITKADHVAKWDGVGWSALGSNTAGDNGWFTTTTTIDALDASGTELVAAGLFQDANGDPRADHVAAFDGSAWHPLGSDGAGNGPIDGHGLALATFHDGIHMGGSFTSAGGDTQARFAASFGAVPVAVPTPTVTQGPPPQPTPTVTPPPDNTPPAVSSLKLSATTFRPFPSGGSIAAVKLGTTVRYRLSEAARVPFVVDLKSPGRKAGKKCVKPKPSNRRKKACVRYVKVGGFMHAGKKGENQFRFSGRIKRKALKPGNYRLVAVAVDAAGNKSAKRSLPFRIVR